MKDNTTETAPERIWLQVDTGATGEDRSEPFPPDVDGVTWHNEEIGGLEVEYVRADIAATGAANSSAFEWLSKRLVAADFEWGEDKETVLVIAMPKGCAVSASLRACVERGMLSERLHQRSNVSDNCVSDEGRNPVD